ncbi:DUF4907 domain-containing protein [Ancylomarina longa]|uniref:DUF4907 domain-containing protein n=1 Tax=Ancylomarina longa TaxID=2487017 RepID=A0A434AW10_9BACT|nr:DUF4907 domain-containing protein [Ancylomarina longa]RUT78659.1 DUF4907 domain-containing protein [Ancylomarina longa]
MKKYKVLLIASVLIIAITAFYFYTTKNESKSVAEKTWTLKTIKIDEGWGYAIYQNDMLTIKQNRIPAIPANTPFVSKESAQKVGEIVLQKIKGHKIPSISKQELQNLGIIDSLFQPIPQN